MIHCTNDQCKTNNKLQKAEKEWEKQSHRLMQNSLEAQILKNQLSQKIWGGESQIILYTVILIAIYSSHAVTSAKKCSGNEKFIIILTQEQHGRLNSAITKRITHQKHTHISLMYRCRKPANDVTGGTETMKNVAWLYVLYVNNHLLVDFQTTNHLQITAPYADNSTICK